jgi:hypothetical protein
MPFPKASHSSTKVFLKLGRARTEFAHSHFQSLEEMVSYWSPTKSILFKECCEGSYNFSIIINKFAIISYQTQESTQDFKSFRATNPA